MNRKSFERYVNEQLKELPLEQQIKDLQKMQSIWIPDLLHARQQKAGTWVPPEKKEEYVFCENCKTYYSKEQNKSNYEREVRTETTFIDAGYGDDDMIGEVEYIVQYKTCPKCSRKAEVGKTRLKIIREWPRRG